MRVIIEADAEAVARRAATMVAKLVRARPKASLALPTGQTPLGLYRELVRLHREEGLDFAGVSCFQLDEYYGLPADDPRSFRSYLQSELLDHLNVSPRRSHALDGAAADPVRECARYEHIIESAGGLDLAVLGIGADGHIGFNEPGSSLGSRTRIKTLTEATARDAAAAATHDGEPLRLALTMGVGTILDARRCLLLATGASMAEPVRLAVEGPITAQVTASALQLHADAYVLLDEPAASALARANYYREVEAAQRSFDRR